ncbi:MAG: class I SAM-dependent methyltransferase [Pseudomonadota bacterium]
MSDTFQRSCDHWSEASRAEMEKFYALASVDYRHLAEAVDWRAWLEDRQKDVGQRPLKLLDVACGSGKFPVALGTYAGIGNAKITPIDYALLDPSGFSIAEAREALQPPFQAGAEYEVTLQELACDPGVFDIVWATHALYAIPEKELETALTRFVDVMAAGGGMGFIAHARSDAHYLRFYQHYLTGFKSGQGVPYSSAEQIADALERLGVAFEVKQISYQNGAPKTARDEVEGYLQRCLFDDTISLEAMQSNPVTGPYLDTCANETDWRFQQHVSLFFLKR